MVLLLAALLVLVDPGHDPAKPGATSARGVPEVQLNDELAALVVARLRAIPGLTVARTRSDAELMSPRARGLLANRRHAALLLSIHHDAPLDTDERAWTFDGRPEHYSEGIRGFSLHVRADDPVAVRVARAIARELVASDFHPSGYHASEYDLVDAKLGIYDRRHLAMLNAAKVPAVLLECGFITDKAEELELEKPEVRAKLAGAVARALGSWPTLLAPPPVVAHARAKTPPAGR